jgi:hypothetical protein
MHTEQNRYSIVCSLRPTLGMLDQPDVDKQCQACCHRDAFLQAEMELGAARHARGRANDDWLQRTAGLRNELKTLQVLH